MARVLTFLSHASEDRVIAERIADDLDKQHFDVFVAHRDIELGSDWGYILKQRIKECDLFAVLLSSKFRNANYTSQEVGIAICLDKKIFPLSIDGTMPFGFMSGYQSSKFDVKKFDEETKKLAELFKRVIDGTLRKTDEVILALKHAELYREANKIGRELATCPDLTNDQLKNLAEAYQLNDQIRDSWAAGPLVRKLLKITD